MLSYYSILCYNFEVIAGGIAQWLEQAAHNRLVAGSSPAAPTKKPFGAIFLSQYRLRYLRSLDPY